VSSPLARRTAQHSTAQHSQSIREVIGGDDLVESDALSVLQHVQLRSRGHLGLDVATDGELERGEELGGAEAGVTVDGGGEGH